MIDINAFTANKQGIKALTAAAAMQLCLGIVYVWSVFVLPVSEHYNWDPASVKLMASYMICFFGLGIFCGGKLQEKIGASKVVLTGGMMLSGGILVTAFVPLSLPWLIYITYGIIGGLGVGIAYNSNVSSAQKWFPNNRGFAAGVTIGAFGFSTVIFAPLIELLIGLFGLQRTFLILFLLYFAAVLFLFRFITFPESTGTVDEALARLLKKKQYSTLEMLTKKTFYFITTIHICGTTAFMVLNPSLKTFAIERGFDPAIGTLIVMLTGVASALGRLSVPAMSDKIGREKSYIVILVINLLCALSLISAQGFLFMAAILFTAFSYGGYAGIIPAVTADYFGIKNVGSNYGAVTAFWSVAALTFPMIISRIDSVSVTLKFVVLIAFAVIGLLALILLVFSKKNLDRE